MRSPGRALLADLEVSGLPALVEPWFERAIEPHDHAEGLTGHRLHPIVFLAAWGCRREPDGVGAIFVRLQAFLETVESSSLLVGFEQAAVQKPPATVS